MSSGSNKRKTSDSELTAAAASGGIGSGSGMSDALESVNSSSGHRTGIDMKRSKVFESDSALTGTSIPRRRRARVLEQLLALLGASVTRSVGSDCES